MRSGLTGTSLACVVVVFFAGSPIPEQQAERILGYRLNSRMEPGTMQPAPWQPPACRIDGSYVQAVQALLGTSLGDPRGGTLSHVEVLVGDAAWGGQQPQRGLGWVMPGGRRAVLVDGLEYEVASVIGAANLDEWLLADRLPPDGFGPFNIAGPTPALPGLLLVHGDVANAERVFEKMGEHIVGTLHRMLVQHLCLRHNMQAADALKRRSDSEAYDFAKRLHSTVVYAEANGVFKPRFEGEAAPFTAAFSRTLVQDAERRSLHPKPRLNLEELPGMPRQARLKRLAEALDDVEAKQWGQPGGLDWFSDPVMKAWAEEGASAVPVLLDVIEHDDRFTRSVSFGRNFFPQRTLHTVRTAAWVVLTAIWPSASAVMSLPVEDRLPALRAQWKAGEGLTEPERWLRVLRDDDAGTKNWLHAGQYITKPKSQRTRGGLVEMAKDPGEAMSGETLRTEHGAEVTGLLSRRALQSIEAQSPARDSSIVFRAADAVRIGRCLAKWDPEAALPTLAKITDAAVRLLGDRSEGNADEELTKEVCRLVADRAAAGDPAAAEAYRDVLRRLGTNSMFEPEVYRALWQSPDHAGIFEVGEAHFGALGSKLKDEAGQEGRSIAAWAVRMVSSPLIAVRPFRLFLADAASVSAPLGTAWVERNASGPSLRYEYEGGQGGGSMGLPAGTSIQDSRSSPVPVSVGDFVAQHVAALPRAPAYLMVAPRLERARAKLAVQRWLRDDSQDWKQIVKELGYFHP